MGPLAVTYTLAFGLDRVVTSAVSAFSYLLWGSTSVDFLVISTTDIGTGSGRIKLS
jgi:hypothetical protein